MASTTREQPSWTPPTVHPGAALPPLKIYNSLTRRKDDFVPVDPAGKAVSWYTCGPTVYDDAHLGHARNYMTTDVLRRIMTDYFGFKVKYVMNVTDVDDKIILRGRQQHLLARFKKDQTAESEDGPVADSVLVEATAAFRQYAQKNLPLLPADVAPDTYAAEVAKAYGPLLDGQAGETPVDPKLAMHARTAQSAAQVLLSPPETSSEFYAKAEDVLLPYLDARHGSSIDSRDHGMFTSLTQKFEQRFFEDMRSLNIRDPDVLTRVTEYVPPIVSFIEGIIANGFAYATSDGSVYFDIDAFERGGHHYAKLEPWSRNDKALQADGEGSLSAKKTAGKHSDNDFALWKASKPGEPAWPSPWGDGRPGWHIECSVMASEVLGKQLDIHSGGIDLRFPHHDNELAQSEAYWSTHTCKPQWSNYFLHPGHLSIQGMKMSKSLKNFTTIRSALAEPEWNARSLRICFLLGAWQDGVEITEELLKSTVSWEGKLNNFFLKGIDVLKNPGQANGKSETASDDDRKVLDALDKAKADLHAALCDSFNTPVAMRALSDLVGELNLARGLSDATVLAATRWVTRIVTIFGLDADGDLADDHRVGWSGIDIPVAAQPHVYPAAQLRDRVRQIVRSGAVDHGQIAKLAEEVGSSSSSDAPANPYQKVSEQFRSDVKRLAEEQAASKDILALCDQLRDAHLWELGIYLEDRDPPLPAVVRQVDRSLLEARAEREQAAEAKREARRQREADEAERKRQLADKARVSPRDLFRTAEYSAWDEGGLPTHDAAGAELAKSRKKKLTKEWERQKKIHEDWLASGGEKA